jgi:hypothetical protein
MSCRFNQIFCSTSLLKICPISIFQDFPVKDFPKILPKIFKISDYFEDLTTNNMVLLRFKIFTFTVRYYSSLSLGERNS